MPVASGILIICLTFMPLLTLQGLEGKLFVPVALTIVFALGVSLLLSLTLVPVLASLLLSGTRSHRAVGDALGHAPVPTAAGGCASPPATRIGGRHRGPGIGCGGLPRHGQGVHADDGRGRYPAATAKAAVHRVAALAGDDPAVQKAIGAAVPEVRHSIGRVGSDELGLDPMGLNETDLFMQLAPRKDCMQPTRTR